MRLALGASLALLALNTPAGAGEAPVERGRIVLSCTVATDQKLGQCQLTREEPGDIGLGDLALGWAAGKTIPAAVGPRRAIDLPLCFNITRQPLQAQLDTVSACDALPSHGVVYFKEDVVTLPKDVVIATNQDIMARMGIPELTPELLKANSGKTLGEVIDAAHIVRPAVVNLTCKVLTNGALDCTAGTDPKNPRYEAAALALVPQFRVKPRTVEGLPAPGTLSFSIKLLKP